MTPRPLAALLALALGCAARAPRPEGPATADAPFRYRAPPLGELLPAPEPAVRTARLGNGLEVVVAERPGATSTEMFFVNRRGGDDTERDRPGLAALTARLVGFAVGRCDGPPGSCAGAPARWGVDHRAARFSGVAEPGEVGTFIRHVAAGVRGFDPSAAAFNDALGHAREEWERRGEGRQLADLVAPAVFDDGTLYSASVAGSTEDLANLRLDRLRELFRRRYVPAHCALVAVGRADLGEVTAWAERMLGPWTGGPPAPRPQTPATFRRGGDRVTLLEAPGRAQAGVLYAIPLRTPDAAGRAAAHVLASAMASTFSSRLLRALRVERGSTYGVHASVLHFGDASVLLTEAEIEEARVGESLRAVRDGFLDVARGGLTSEEFDRARRRALVAWQAASDEDDGFTALLLDGVSEGRSPPWSPPDWVAGMDGLDAAVGNARLAAALADAEPRVFVRGDPTRLRGELEALGMGPVVTVAPE